MTMNPTIELVAFDLGNVLCSVSEVPASEKLASLSNRPVDEVHEIVFGKARKALFETATMTFSEHAERAIATLDIPMTVEEFTKLYDSVLIPSHGMFPLVARIAEKHQIALVSNTSEPHWLTAKRFLPFSSQLNPVIVSYEVDAMKPDKAFYDALLSQVQIPAEQVLFIDDLPENIEAARKTGMNVHHFTGQPALESALAELGII